MQNVNIERYVFRVYGNHTLTDPQNGMTLLPADVRLKYVWRFKVNLLMDMDG